MVNQSQPNMEELSCDDSGSMAASSTTGVENSAGSAKSILQEQITRQETKVVFQLRLFVVLVLLAAGCGISYTVFNITQEGQIKHFESQYEAAAQKVSNSFEFIVRQIGAVSALSIAYSALAENSWPLVTIDYFQERAGNVRFLSGALFVSISPVVMPGYVKLWEQYVNGPASSWIHEGHEFQKRNGYDDFEDDSNVAKSVLTNQTVDPIHYFDKDGYSHAIEKLRLFLPIWQTSPVLKTRLVNEDLFTRPNVSDVVKRVLFNEVAVFGRFIKSPAGNASSPDPTTALFATLLSIKEKQAVSYNGEPMAHLYFPIFNHLNETKKAPVAVMTSVIHWRSYFENILTENMKGIRVVLENSCDGNYTYDLSGSMAEAIGPGDQHESAFARYRRVAELNVEFFHDGTGSGVKIDHEGCAYSLKVYPSQEFYAQFVTESPALITLAIAAVFTFAVFMFFVYDRLVEKRQSIVLKQAMQSTAIVSSLFPKNVHERLMKGAQDDAEKDLPNNKNRLKGFINGAEGGQLEEKAIADLFPHCTVFFGDIAGFTAWSSTRDPEQVFILLQNVYQAFDTLAKRRKVFKVETIGDCYMAVTGLPEPMDGHAVVMARFANDCLNKIRDIVQGLETSLGPDTGNLTMRIGIHSGPVTAGVLRGDRARFQLFGDTVNTASRMESTGQAGKIHASAQVVDLLKKGGKAHWVLRRKDLISAKGKGNLQTFFIQPKSKRGSSTASEDDTHASSAELSDDKREEQLSQNQRLIEWVVDFLLEDIRKLMATYQKSGIKPKSEAVLFHPQEGQICMDEVCSVLDMPKFNKKTTAISSSTEASSDDVIIEEDVVESLRAFVIAIADRYNNNPFHNFEHACHVTMSVKKLLKRIMEPDISISEHADLASHLHDYSFGIYSDTLGNFALVFSALIHDVDHRGVSNIQLMNEEPSMAKRYRGKSLAEQNSLDIAWDILMEERFANLRKCLFPTEIELMRFRKLIVNVVLATDIFDADLSDLRKSRWNRAFSPSNPEAISTEDESPVMDDLRATIVLEHIIQASDVSHTMQHWQVYQKWNRSLFLELHSAYRAGRMSKDPATFWYNGELGFFDNYVIPLAKKLEECGVFGVSSDEYLNYAMQNRAEWERRGQEIVEELVALAAKEEAKEKDAASLHKYEM